MTKDQTSWVPVVLLAGGCGPAGFDNLEGFGEAGDEEGSGTSSDEATSDDDPFEGPFELLEAERTDDDSLLLTFSHPLASLEGVDPDAFRISFGFSTRYVGYYGSYYDNTSYRDPNYFNYYFDPFWAITLAPGPDDAQLRIDFSAPLTSEACNLIAIWEDEPIEPPNGREVGIFVHYRPSPIPVQDGQGSELAAIGPDWVDYEGNLLNLYGEFGFVDLNPRVPIPCP